MFASTGSQLQPDDGVPHTVSSNKDDARASIFQDSPRIKPARYACMLVCLYAGISSGKIDGE
jgi:hypothetical protein